MSPKLVGRLIVAVALAVRDEAGWWLEARRVRRELSTLGCKSNREIDQMPARGRR